MKNFEKLLATVGLLGLAMSVLAFVFNLNSVATAGFIVFFACVMSLIVNTAIRGYNPVER